MEEASSRWIDVAQLRRGLFIQLELGWMDHPFPKGSFKITSNDQIKTILSLGLSQVRCRFDLSDAVDESVLAPLGEPEGYSNWSSGFGVLDAESRVQSNNSPAQSEAEMLRLQRRNRLAAQRRSLAVCERRFSQATELYRRVAEQASTKPVQMRADSWALVTRCVKDILCEGESAIRLLSEAMGERSAVHEGRWPACPEASGTRSYFSTSPG